VNVVHPIIKSRDGGKYSWIVLDRSLFLQKAEKEVQGKPRRPMPGRLRIRRFSAVNLSCLAQAQH
jgi:hypothetical protein